MNVTDSTMNRAYTFIYIYIYVVEVYSFHGRFSFAFLFFHSHFCLFAHSGCRARRLVIFECIGLLAYSMCIAVILLNLSYLGGGGKQLAFRSFRRLSSTNQYTSLSLQCSFARFAFWTLCLHRNREKVCCVCVASCLQTHLVCIRKLFGFLFFLTLQPQSISCITYVFLIRFHISFSRAVCQVQHIFTNLKKSHIYEVVR